MVSSHILVKLCVIILYWLSTVRRVNSYSNEFILPVQGNSHLADFSAYHARQWSPKQPSTTSRQSKVKQSQRDLQLLVQQQPQSQQPLHVQQKFYYLPSTTWLPSSMYWTPYLLNSNTEYPAKEPNAKKPLTIILLTDEFNSFIAAPTKITTTTTTLAPTTETNVAVETTAENILVGDIDSSEESKENLENASEGLPESEFGELAANDATHIEKPNIGHRITNELETPICPSGMFTWLCEYVQNVKPMNAQQMFKPSHDYDKESDSPIQRAYLEIIPKRFQHD